MSVRPTPSDSVASSIQDTGPSDDPSRTMDPTLALSNDVPLTFGSYSLPGLATLRELSLNGRIAAEREGMLSLVNYLELTLPSLITGEMPPDPYEKEQLIPFLQVKLECIKSLLAPIRKLPTEILSEIFLYCQILEQARSTNDIDLAEIEVDNGNFRPALLVGRGGGTLWKLTHICHQWRALLLHTPSAWSVLYITNYTRSSAKQLALCLSRSGTLPLRFSLHEEHKGDGGYDSDPSMYLGFATSHKRILTPYLDLLYAHAHRWSKVFLTETDYGVLTRNPNRPATRSPGLPAPNWLELPPAPHSSSSFPSSFPLLHTLGLHNTLDLYRLEMYHVLSLFSPTSAPTLRHLILSKFTKIGLQHESCSPQTKLPASIDVFPWVQLTSLTLLETSAFAAITLISKSLNLTRLRVSASLLCATDGTSTVYPTVTLNKLEVFAIQGWDERIKPYFDHLTTPSLRVFRVRCDEYHSRRQFVKIKEAVADFLKRSGFSGRGDVNLDCKNDKEVNSTTFGGL